MYSAKVLSSDHLDLIHDVAFNWYGTHLATCSSDQTVKVSLDAPQLTLRIFRLSPVEGLDVGQAEELMVMRGLLEIPLRRRLESHLGASGVRAGQKYHVPSHSALGDALVRHDA